MGERKSMAINMVSQILSFAISLAISFFLTRYIAELLGKDVYGFVGLANTFTGYVIVFTSAVNSMLYRYVTIAFQRKEYNKASSYFSSVIITDSVIAALLVLPAAGIVYSIEKLFDVPSNHVVDIKILWLFIFINFLVGLSVGGYNVGTYCTNRLDLSAKREIEANLLKAAILIITYVFFKPKIWYLGLAIFVCGIYGYIANIRYKKRLTPQIKLRLAYFRIKSVSELVGTGIWSSFNQLTQTLINGFDLLFANEFLGALDMSLMSYSKTVSVQIFNFIGLSSKVYGPKLTITYAEGNMERFKNTVNSSLRISGFIGSVPIIGFMVFGSPFFKLWLNMLTNEEIKLIQLLSILTLIPIMFAVYIYPLYTVNSITRNLKIPVLVSFGIGVMNIILVPVLIQFTSFGLIAIKVVSSVLLTLRVFLFVPIYTAYSINMKWTTFYPPMARGMISSVILITVYWVANTYVNIDSWAKLVVISLICGVFGYFINYFVLLSEYEREIIHEIIARRLPIKEIKK